MRRAAARPGRLRARRSRDAPQRSSTPKSVTLRKRVATTRCAVPPQPQYAVLRIAFEPRRVLLQVHNYVAVIEDMTPEAVRVMRHAWAPEFVVESFALQRNKAYQCQHTQASNIRRFARFSSRRPSSRRVPSSTTRRRTWAGILRRRTRRSGGCSSAAATRWVARLAARSPEPACSGHFFFYFSVVRPAQA